MRPRKTLLKILAGSPERAVSGYGWIGLCLGFRQVRTSGSHFIFNHPNVRELINLQNVGGQAKPYQVRQFMKLVEKYNLQLRDE